MTLRARLARAFALVVLVPVLTVAVAVAVLAPRAGEQQRQERLVAAVDEVQAAAADLCARAAIAARAAALDALSRGPAVAATTAAGPGVTGVVVADGAGRVLARAGSPPAAGPGSGCRPQGGALTGRGEARARAAAATRVAVVGLDAASALPRGGPAVALLDAQGRPVAGQARPPEGRTALQRSLVAVPGWQVVASTPAPGQGALWAGLALGTLVVAALAALLGRRYALVLTRPVAEVGSAARRLAEGDLEARVAVRGGDEVADLGLAFNTMAAELELTLRQLQRGRDQLRRDVVRIGDALARTHDLVGLLDVVLDTVVESSGAAAGAVYLVSHERGDASLAASRGLEGRLADPAPRLPLGVGVVGAVAADGTTRHGALPTDPAEPWAGQVLAVPVKGTSPQVLAVLSLYDRPGEPFRAEDVELAQTLAGQAGVAVANVLLHREAERLSVTDSLTGLANRRAFQRQLAREVDRAERFGRTLGLLLLDLDHFKQVNDRHGHQAGDAVLAATARALRDAVRDVDTVARYGGEELVAVLPETDAAGAARLAERICAAVRSTPTEVPDGAPVEVTVSIGVAAYPQHGSTPALLLRAADAAMYAAKGAGRDTWRVAGGGAPPG